MGGLAGSLALDEYSDVQHSLLSHTMDACIELELEDYEWDETEKWASSLPLTAAQPLLWLLPTPTLVSRCIMHTCSEALLAAAWTMGPQTLRTTSHRKRLGLVSRYAPRKGIASDNSTLTNYTV